MQFTAHIRGYDKAVRSGGSIDYSYAGVKYLTELSDNHENRDKLGQRGLAVGVCQYGGASFGGAAAEGVDNSA